MPAVQSAYGANIAAAVAGMLANMEIKGIISRLQEDATPIGFGKAVFQGSGQRGITATPAANKFRGITVADPTLDPANSDAYPQYASVGVLNRGVIWVVAGATISTPYVPVYVTSGGAFTDVSTSNVLLPNTYFETIGASGALVQVRIGNPG